MLLEVTTPECDVCASKPSLYKFRTSCEEEARECYCTILEPVFETPLTLQIIPYIFSPCTELAIPGCVSVGRVHCTLCYPQRLCSYPDGLRFRSTYQSTWTYVCILGGWLPCCHWMFGSDLDAFNNDVSDLSDKTTPDFIHVMFATVKRLARGLWCNMFLHSMKISAHILGFT